MKKIIIFCSIILIFTVFAISFTGDVILNSPADDSTSLILSIFFNASTNITDGKVLNNMSLWTNETGTWQEYNTTNPLGVYPYSFFESNYIDILESYYKLDNSSGDAYDMRRNNDGTISGATRNVQGILNNAFEFDGDNDVISGVADVKGYADGSITFWFKTDVLNANQDIYSTHSADHDSKVGLINANIHSSNQGQWDLKSSTNIESNKWYFFAFTWNATGEYLYLDSNLENSSSDGGGWDATGSSAVIGYRAVDQDQDFNGTLDEFAVWNDSLTAEQITNLSKGTFKTQTWNRTISDGIIWNIKACDEDGSCEFATSNYTLNLDQTIPQIEIETPTGTLNYNSLGSNEVLNVTFTDSNLASCWYNYNGTNVTIDGCLTTIKNSTNFILEEDNFNLTIYVNDTIGNENSTFIEWDYLVFEESSEYNQIVTEGSSQDFSINATLSNSLRISDVEFYYNGTSYVGSFNEYATNKYTLSRTQAIPSISADINVSFYWNITFENGQSQATSSNNQTITDLKIDDCSAYSNMLFNFTLVDEDTQLKLDGSGQNTSIKVDMSLSNINTLNEVINISQNYTLVNPAAICIESDLGNSTFRVDALIEYSSLNRFTEFYNIQNYTLTNTTDNQNITLYNLNSTKGQEFEITYKDANFNTVPGAIINIQRKYVEEGKFKTIEIPMVGGSGTTIAHLIRNDVLYNLIILKNGTVLDTFQDVVASCQNPALTKCQININSFSSGISPQDFSTDSGFASTISYNKTTRVVSTTFAITSGVSQFTSLNVTLWDSYLNTSVCSDGLDASGGTLSCTIPNNYGNTTVVVKIISGGIEKRKAIIILAEDPENIYGHNLVFVSLMIILLIIGISISDNPMTLGIMLIFGTIVLIVLNVVSNAGWIGGGATILWLIIAIIIILIKGSNRQ